MRKMPDNEFAAILLVLLLLVPAVIKLEHGGHGFLLLREILFVIRRDEERVITVRHRADYRAWLRLQHLRRVERIRMLQLLWGVLLVHETLASHQAHLVLAPVRGVH